MDFNLDGMVEKWEWKLKNLTRLVFMLEENKLSSPIAKPRHSTQQWLKQTGSNDTMLKSIQDRYVR